MHDIERKRWEKDRRGKEKFRVGRWENAHLFLYVYPYM